MFETAGLNINSQKAHNEKDVFLTLKALYGSWARPNAGDIKDTVFRVGHIGALTKEHNTTLVNTFKDLQKRGLI